MFDLDLVTPEAGELKLVHPVTKAPLVDEDGNQATIMLVGIDSPQHQRADHEVSALKYRLMADKVPATAKDVEEHDTIYLVHCTLGWKHLARGGKPLEFSADEARRLYTDPKLRWLRDAVYRFIIERRNFFRPL